MSIRLFASLVLFCAVAPAQPLRCSEWLLIDQVAAPIPLPLSESEALVSQVQLVVNTKDVSERSIIGIARLGGQRSSGYGRVFLHHPSQPQDNPEGFRFQGSQSLQVSRSGNLALLWSQNKTVPTEIEKQPVLFELPELLTRPLEQVSSHADLAPLTELTTIFEADRLVVYDLVFRHSHFETQLALPPHQKEPVFGAFVLSRENLLFLHRGGRVSLWSMPQERELDSIHLAGKISEDFTTVQLSPDRSLLCVLNFSPELGPTRMILGIENQKIVPLQTVSNPELDVHQGSQDVFLGNSGLYLTEDADRHYSLWWRTQRWGKIELPAHMSVPSFQISADGKWIALLDREGTSLLVWSVSDPEHAVGYTPSMEGRLFLSVNFDPVRNDILVTESEGLSYWLYLE